MRVHSFTWRTLRALNKWMKGDGLLLPKTEEGLDDLLGSNLLSKLDMLSRYQQVRLEDHVQDKTYFRWKYGYFYFQVMPYGLMITPDMFQRMDSELFG